jgi:hypothetical protein
MPQPSLGSGARRETPRTHLFDDGVTSVGRSSRGFVSQTSPAPIGVNAAPAPSRSCSSPPCRPLRRPFDDFSRFRNPTRPLDDKFFNNSPCAREPNGRNGGFRSKSRYQSRAQAEPCHRVPTIGIKHRYACRLLVRPTIQVSSEDTRAWHSISWNGVTRGAMPVLAPNPEWPLLAEAARAAAIAKRERLTGSDGSGFSQFSPP